MTKKLIVFMLMLCVVFSMMSICAYATDIGNIPATDPKASDPPVSTEFPEGNPDDVSVTKVYLQLKYEKPIVFNKVSACVASCGTEGCTVTKMTWYDPNGNLVTGDTFTIHGTYKLEITVSVKSGYAFTNTTAVYLNNARAACTVGAEVIKVTATMQSVYWAPMVNVQPDTRTQTLTEGDCKTFTASASYYDKCTWKVLTPAGKIYSLVKSADKFEGLTVIGADTATLQLNNIPLSMNGCRVYCTFSNDAAYTDTQGIPLVVNKDPNKVEPTPAPTPTPDPSPEVSPAPEENPGESNASPAVEVTPDPAHVHSFLDSWNSDGESHWHECACGAIMGVEAHTLTWTTLRAATDTQVGEEQGTCSVCGYTTVREIEKQMSSGAKLAVIIPAVIVIITVMGILFVMTQRAKAQYSNSKHGKR